MSKTPPRPASDDDRAGCMASRETRRMEWRIEPDIDEACQTYLAERRAVKPDIEKGIYPFHDENGSIKLTRAEVEWLLATQKTGSSDGLDLRGADLRGANLRNLPLARMRGGLDFNERAASGSSYQSRELAAVHLEGADLSGANLEGAKLSRAHLENAILRKTHLANADLYWARLGGVTFTEADLQGADLTYAFFDTTTYLRGVTLTDHGTNPALLDGIRWGEADLSEVNWAQVSVLGEEQRARQPIGKDGWTKTNVTRDTEYRVAVRTNRRLAALLRTQGLNESADHFAYRAQLLQRVVLRREGHYLRYLGSLCLDIIAGYGFRPLRSFATYLVVVGAFAGVYALLAHFGLTTESLGSWDSPVVLSVTSFHGRVFFAGGLSLSDWAARVGAVEAAVGLLVEITFIATFTQRFFAR